MARPIPRPARWLTALGAISTGVVITVPIPGWMIIGLAGIVLIGVLTLIAGVLFSRRPEPCDRLQRLVQLIRPQRTDEHVEDSTHTIE